MCTTKDQSFKDLIACVRAWDFAAFDQMVDTHGTHEVAHLLFELIENVDVDLAEAAASKLHGLPVGAEFGAVEFLRLLSHPSEDVRIRATSCLYTIDNANARCFIWCLHNMLTGAPDLFTASAYALRKTFDGTTWGTSRDGLLTALAMDAALPTAVGNCGGFAAVLDTWSRFSEPFRRIVGNQGSVQTLLEDLDSLGTAERMVRVAAAGWGEDGAMEALTKLSHSECLHTKLLAIINLRQFSTQFDRDAYGAIVSHLNSRNDLVRRAASRVLLESGNNARNVVQAVIHALEDPDLDVRWNLVTTVGNIGPPAATAVPRLINIVNAGDDGCRFAAIRALGKIGSSSLPAVLPMLRSLQRRGPGVPFTWVLSFALRGILCPTESNEMKKIVVGLGEALNDADPEVRSVAAFGLSLVGQSATSVLAQINSRLNDECPDVRFWLGALLEDITPSDDR